MNLRPSWVRSFLISHTSLVHVGVRLLSDLYEFPTHGGVRPLLGIVNY